jgi:hypothetical protein
MLTIQQAKDKAQNLVDLYPHITNVQDLIDKAKEDKQFANEVELIIVWGRVCRLLPQKENN